MAKMAKMAKMSKCGMDMGMGKGLGMNILMLVVYLVIAYVIYQIVMYFLGSRTSAMPNVPAPKGGMGGSCASGTCGANKERMQVLNE
jgi:hypothetical protein